MSDWQTDAEMLWGPNWVAPMAAVFKIGRRTIERWKAGAQPINSHVRRDLASLAARRRRNSNMSATVAGEQIQRLRLLILACQQISAMAPKEPGPPKTEGPRPDDPTDISDVVGDLAYDVGFYEAAEIVRAALREAGIEPQAGTTEWYHEISRRVTAG